MPESRLMPAEQFFSILGYVGASILVVLIVGAAIGLYLRLYGE